MKTEDYSNLKNIEKQDNTDDFWKDCLDPKEKKPSLSKLINNQNIIQNTDRQKITKFRNLDLGSNGELNEKKRYNEQNLGISKKSNIKTYQSNKLFNPKNRSNNSFNFGNKLNNSMEKYLLHICHRHPSVLEEIKEEERKKLKSKNAIIRCYGLYAYGVELQKAIQMNKKNNDIKKLKDDISLCTFRPKINKKISYLNDNIEYEGRKNKNFYKIRNTKKSNSLDVYNTKDKNIYKNTNNDKNLYDDYVEMTFKPKLNDPQKVKKIFKNRRIRNKFISDDKENAEFILRYTKARDEYLIKRFKQLYKKDESYQNSLISLTRRLCNDQYRNYLNVNNTIQLFGESLNINHKINSSIADFKGLTINNIAPENKRKTKNGNLITGLRKNLQSLDLNDSYDD
jgi:hypothetical protein